ncbi:MAG TPA: sigma-54 dependent transcriptional regulator [Armatimonadota bacterium]|jgi:Nif-specific regulatory protein
MEQPVGRLMVVDDEPNICRVLSALFERAGYKVATYGNAQQALAAIIDDPEIDAVITDLMMPEMSGLEFLKALRERGLDQPVLMITAHGNVDTAVEAMKSGAFDYVSKPFDAEEVRFKIERAIRTYSLQRENDYLRTELRTRYKFDNIIGSSAAMQEVYNLIAKAARSKANVLVRGESGTGKELVARALHYNSPRSNKKFIPVSCAALPNEILESELFGHEKGAFTGALWQKPGRFELADNGTLFLDEIGDISANVQIKLLRVLQEKEFERVGGIKPLKVDVRLIAATNHNLEQAVVKGDFREDLYYRLRVIQITIPPLRERLDDVPFLVEHFIKKYGQQDGRKIRTVEPQAMELLQRYDWPGNIRELENAMEYAVVLADEGATTITGDMLPLNVQLNQGVRRMEMPMYPPPAPVAQPYVAAAPQPVAFAPAAPAPEPAGDSKANFSGAVAETEKKMLLDALQQTNWNLTRAAELLGISFRSMRYNVKKYNLTKE